MEPNTVSQRHRIILLLLAAVVFITIGTEPGSISEKYQEIKEESGVKFTRELLSQVPSKLQCFIACNLDTTCL